MKAYTSTEDLIRRAISAYYRHGAKAEPASARSERREHDGKEYIVLANVRGILAVYRVRHVGGKDVLKRLKRWPAALGEVVR